MSLEPYHLIFILLILCNINIQHNASHVLRQYQNWNHIIVNSTPRYPLVNLDHIYSGKRKIITILSQFQYSFPL